MTQVRITETYDLSTEVDQLGIIGIHTPSSVPINDLYPGLVINNRKIRLVGCDVTIACASMLPADPLQIGTEAGSIAPQDMFNPILYTAVSNDRFNTIQNRIMAGTNVSDYGSVGKADLLLDDDFAVYYALLADSDGWKKAMPQSGLSMTGLYPIVYEVLSPQAAPGVVNRNGITSGVATLDDLNTTETVQVNLFRGNSKRMPAIPLHLYPGDDAVADGSGNWFPTTYVACIVMPPAKLHKLYYRMAVTWTYEFIDVIPVTEYATGTFLENFGSHAYASDYASQSSKMDTKTDTVDVKGASITKIMTSTK